MRSLRALSYINNLHPKTHPELYLVIEQIVAKAIPLWNQTLTQVTNERKIPSRLKVPGDGYQERCQSPRQLKSETSEDLERKWDVYEKGKEARTILQPEPKDFKPTRTRIKKVDLRKNYGKIQVIIKLANIHLTPEKPSYSGGSWHVEGQLNENMYVQPSALTRSFLKEFQMCHGFVLL